MDNIYKSARLEKQGMVSGELDLINKQTLRPMAAEEVYTFRLAACDNLVDRDFERFTDAALAGLAPLFVGKSVLMDHRWAAGAQTARVYNAYVEETDERKRLILCCYMPRTERNADIIHSIETGILRECSVGCQMEHVFCSICGADHVKTCCHHIPGQEYDGALCFMELDGAKDAYEVSLVAVPAQVEAGVVKSKRYGGKDQPPAPDPREANKPTVMQLLGNIFNEEERK